MRARATVAVALVSSASLMLAASASALPRLPRLDHHMTLRPHDGQLERPSPDSIPAPLPCGRFSFAVDLRQGGRVAASFANECYPAVDMNLMAELVLDEGAIVVTRPLDGSDTVALSIPISQVPRGPHRVTLRVLGTRQAGTKEFVRESIYQAQQSRAFFR
jgi:hypothetical protein